MFRTLGSGCREEVRHPLSPKTGLQQRYSSGKMLLRDVQMEARTALFFLDVLDVHFLHIRLWKDLLLDMSVDTRF